MVVGVLGQDSVAVPDPAVEDGDINHARVLTLSLDMEEEIASVTDLYHIVATHNIVKVRSSIPKKKKLKKFPDHVKDP